MQLGEDDIREFQELWRKEFGESISPADARQHASRLLDLYWLLAHEPGKSAGASASHEPAIP